MKLQGVMLGSENPHVLGEFYNKVFGEAGWRQDDWYGFNIDGGTLMIGSHSEVHGKNADSPRIIISVVSSDVKKDFDAIRAVGGGVVAEPYQPDEVNSPDVWLATLSDPDNNYIQLSTPWEE